jgi:hypothetical protein
VFGYSELNFAKSKWRTMLLTCHVIVFLWADATLRKKVYLTQHAQIRNVNHVIEPLYCHMLSLVTFICIDFLINRTEHERT